MSEEHATIEALVTMSEEHGSIEALVDAVTGTITTVTTVQTQQTESETVPSIHSEAVAGTVVADSTSDDVLETTVAQLTAAAEASENPPVTIYFENVDENMEKALQLVQGEGMYVAKAAREAGVTVQDLEAIVKAMKERGELTINWDLQKRPKEKPKYDQEGNVVEKKKRNFMDWNYTGDDVRAAADAVKSGEYSVKGAHKAFRVPINDIRKAMKGEPVEGRICTPGFIRQRKRGNKLTEEEEKVVLEYGFALHKLKHPVSIRNMAPLAKQLLQLRDDTLKDENGWWLGFIKRHQELEGIYQTPKALNELAKDRHHWAKLYFSRLVEVFEGSEFFSKPSRIYACEIAQFGVERWESDGAKLVEVEMLVAANAVGYHVLPPCVVYANNSDDIPDFLGLPEAGFVAADEQKVTGAIFTEWFRSVFLHYLPARSADDPVMLIMGGTNEWLTPELITMAEQQFVYLVPIHTQVLKYLNPIYPLLNKLKGAYKDKLSEYKQAELMEQADNPPKDPFFPVTFRKLFASGFSMYEIQEAFRTRGVFPLKPDEADLDAKEEKETVDSKLKKISKKYRRPDYPKTYKEMLRTDIKYVPPPRPVTNIGAPLLTQMPMTLPGGPMTLPGGFVMSPVGLPMQLNQLQMVNPLLARSVVGATPVVNASAASTSSTLVSATPVVNASAAPASSTVVGTTLTTAQPNIQTNVVNPVPAVLMSKVANVVNPVPVVPTSQVEVTQEKDNKLSKAFTPEVLSMVKEVQNGKRPPSMLNKPRSEQEKQDRLSKAFGTDVLNTVVQVKKQTDIRNKRTMNYIEKSRGARSTAATPPATEGADVVSTSVVESSKSPASVDAGEGVALEESQDVSQVTSDTPSSPPIVVRITKASDAELDTPETDSIDAETPPADESSEVTDAPSKSGAVPSPTSPTTRSKAKEIAATSPKTKTTVTSPSTRSKLKNASSCSDVSSSSGEGTSAAAPDSARVGTQGKHRVMSKLVSSGILGTASDAEENTEEDYSPDPEVVSSDWDSDEDGERSRARKKKRLEKKKSPEADKAPKFTLAPNVNVPSSVIDRIQSMISENSTLLTNLDEEAEEKRKKPTEPEKVDKPDEKKDTAEERLKKAFSPDVLNSVLAVKKDLAKRPKIPDPVRPIQIGTPGANFMYTLPGGGQFLSPFAQQPIIINTIPVPAGMALVPVNAPKPVEAGDKTNDKDESSASTETEKNTKNGKDGKKGKRKKDTGGENDTEAKDHSRKIRTRGAKSKKQGAKDTAKSTKKKKADAADDDDDNDDNYVPQSSNEQETDQTETPVRKSGRKRVTPSNPEFINLDETPELMRKSTRKRVTPTDPAFTTLDEIPELDSSDGKKINVGQETDQTETPVRKSARKRVASADPEFITLDESPESYGSESKKLTGAQKRKASFLTRASNAVQDEVKRSKNETPTAGIQTRAKRLGNSGNVSKRTRSMNK